MFKFIVIMIMLASGYGTIPCLLYLIWATMCENQEKNEQRNK